jgi:WD40 repeat protein
MGNQPPKFARLEVPSFDLTWGEINGKAVALIPGGGGGFKSGVNNQIQFFKLGEKQFELVSDGRFLTDVDGKSCLCSGITVGASSGRKIVVAILGATCAVLVVKKGPADENLRLKRVAEFRADFSDDGTVNCASVLPTGHIITGSDDGVVRLWRVQFAEDSTCAVKLEFELCGHISPVMSISYHPKDALVSRF